MQNVPQWLLWAGLSAVFAALTALFAKVGVKGVDPDLAMAIRTLVVAAVILPLVVVTGKWSNPLLLPGRTQLFLVLSALATGASWLFYFRALQSGELAKVARNPFPDAAGNRVVALFLDGSLPADPLDGVTGRRDEQLALGTREIFIHYGAGMADSRLRIPGSAQGTARNLNTVARLAAMAAELR